MSATISPLVFNAVIAGNAKGYLMTYRISLTRGNYSVEVEGPEQEFVESTIQEYWAAQGCSEGTDESPGVIQQAPANVGRPTSLFELYQQVKPMQKQQEVAVIAFYLENYVNPPMEYWRAADILHRWNETRARNKPGNINGTIAQSGYFLRGPDAGQWQLSNTGLDWLREKFIFNE